MDIRHTRLDSHARSGAPPVTIERIADMAGLARIEGEWARIQAACPWKHVLLDPRWVAAWWRHFGAGKELHILVLRQGGEIVGIAPLVLSSGWELFPARDSRLEIADDYAHLPVPRWQRVVPIRRVTFPLNIASHNARAHFLLADERPDHVRAILDYWAARADRWDLLCLEGLPVGSRQPELVAAEGAALGLRVLPHGVTRTFYAIGLEGSLDAYLASRSRHFRGRFRAQLRACEAAGAITIDEMRGADVDAGLAILYDIEARSWKARAGHGRAMTLSLDQRIRSFFSEVGRSFAAHDRALVLVMRLDGRPVGGLYALASGGVNLSLVMYLEDAVRSSLNMTPLWARLIERSIDRGMDLVDTHGISPYTRKLRNKESRHRRLYLFNRSAWSTSLYLLKKTATQASRWSRRWRGGTRPPAGDDADAVSGGPEG